MFQQIGVKGKLILSFGFLLLLLAIASGVAWSALRNASQGFEEYRGLARDANFSGDAHAELIQTRVQVREYLMTGSEQDQREFQEAYRAMMGALEEAQERIENPSRIEMVRRAVRHAREYGSEFDRMAQQIERQQQLYAGTIVRRGEEAEQALVKLMDLVEEADDRSILTAVSQALRHLMQGRLSAARYIVTHARADADHVSRALRLCDEQLGALRNGLTNVESRRLHESAESALRDWTQAFEDLSEAIGAGNAAMGSLMDTIGPAMASEMASMRQSVVDDQGVLGARLEAANQRAVSFIMSLSIVALMVGTALALILATSISRALVRSIDSLTVSAEQIASASGQISQSSQSLAAEATEQASSLEESSSALEELAGQARSNTEKTDGAAGAASEAREASNQAGEAMREMVRAMQDIKESSGQISNIIKTIEDIAFQTNLLALNAAVEAARAGDHGKGFAVVAEEVRNLAQRAAGAAKDTARLIESSVDQTQNGAVVVDRAAASIENIQRAIVQVAASCQDIKVASQEQATGVVQINGAVAQMDKVTQNVAANAEESASASEELSALAQQLQAVVYDLNAMVGGQGGNGRGAGVARSTLSRSASRQSVSEPNVISRRPAEPIPQRNVLSASQHFQDF